MGGSIALRPRAKERTLQQTRDTSRKEGDTACHTRICSHRFGFHSNVPCASSSHGRLAGPGEAEKALPLATENASASPHRPGDPEPFPRPAEDFVRPQCLRSELSLHPLPHPWPGCPPSSCSDHSREGRGSNPASMSLHPAGHRATVRTISCSKAPMPGKAKRRLFLLWLRAQTSRPQLPG